MPEIIVTKWAARDLTTATPRNPDPHLIFHSGWILVVTPGEWRDKYRPDGARLIMTHADLLDTDPGAFDYDPAALAELLSDYASNLDPS